MVGSCRVAIIYHFMSKSRLNSDSFSIYLIFSIFEKNLPYVIAIIYFALCQNVIINISILTV